MYQRWCSDQPAMYLDSGRLQTVAAPYLPTFHIYHLSVCGVDLFANVSSHWQVRTTAAAALTRGPLTFVMPTRSLVTLADRLAFPLSAERVCCDLLWAWHHCAVKAYYSPPPLWPAAALTGRPVCHGRSAAKCSAATLSCSCGHCGPFPSLREGIARPFGSAHSVAGRRSSTRARRCCRCPPNSSTCSWRGSPMSSVRTTKRRTSPGTHCGTHGSTLWASRRAGCHGRHWPACAAESGSQSMAAAAPPRAVTTLVDQRSGAMPVAALISRTALRESHMG